MFKIIVLGDEAVDLQDLRQYLKVSIQAGCTLIDRALLFETLSIPFCMQLPCNEIQLS